MSEIRQMNMLLIYRAEAIQIILASIARNLRMKLWNIREFNEYASIDDFDEALLCDSYEAAWRQYFYCENCRWYSHSPINYH